ncbi:MAG: hypothetical protein H7246_00950 [Phycisphaerae bacterium]|nr:hypothetical protein [Saprospiraceae bacterium]
MSGKKRFLEIFINAFHSNRNAARALGIAPANITFAIKNDSEGSQNGILAKAFEKGFMQEVFATGVIQQFEADEEEIIRLKEERATLRANARKLSLGLGEYFTEMSKNYDDAQPAAVTV